MEFHNSKESLSQFLILPLIQARHKAGYRDELLDLLNKYDHLMGWRKVVEPMNNLFM